MKRESLGKGWAFTLIELLIVVAIIAILAAIAVPNFLEAQVRSKVSRVKSDMRTIATALEAYAVDVNRVPPGMVESTQIPMLPAGIYVLNRLTTPIAYLTSVPKDPFVDKGTLSAKNVAFNFSGAPPSYETIPPVDRQIKLGGAFLNAHWKPAAGFGYTWLLSSYGPTKKQGVNAIAGLGKSVTNYMGAFYDPTNGTVSMGQIIRTNMGQH